MDTLDTEKVGEFFKLLDETFKPRIRPATIIVTHLLPDRHFLLDAVSVQAEIAAILPKPKTQDEMVRKFLSSKFRIEDLSRNLSVDKICELLEGRKEADHGVVFLDIGGYFAPHLSEFDKRYPGKLLGVVEDTENGHKRYQNLDRVPCPVVSVARSPLKRPEDFLVGQSVVFSTEALLRERGDIIHGRTACVIGYGKLGRSIANLLHARHVRTVIYDQDPVTMVEAMSHGFSVAPTLEGALKGAGLVFCATGNMSLRSDQFTLVENGAYIATVTSSDDEIDIESIKNEYTIRQVTNYVSKYEKGARWFYVLNRGQAVNFIHGAAVGPFIYLVHGEILASMARLIDGGLSSGLHENDQTLRERVAAPWLSVFGPRAVREELHASTERQVDR